MSKTAVAATLAVISFTAVPDGHTASYDHPPPIVKHLGVPSTSGTPPLRIISGDAGDGIVKLAYSCGYRYVYDASGKQVQRWVCG
jgi:hypothetical protein